MSANYSQSNIASVDNKILLTDNSGTKVAISAIPQSLSGPYNYNIVLPTAAPSLSGVLVCIGISGNNIITSWGSV
jgi:hypothetical protein